jgi:hypothetical protein
MGISESDTQAKAASDTGNLVRNVAGAAAPSKSSLSRIVDTVAAAKVGAKLLPGAWRMFKRHPWGALLVVVGVASAVRMFWTEGAYGRRKPVA